MNASLTSLAQDPAYISCGHFGKTVGLKGQIRFYPSSGQLDTLSQIHTLYLSNSKALSIDTISERKDFFVFQLEGLESLEQASVLVNQKAYVAKKDLPDLEKNTFYWYQLVGLQVLNAQEEDLGQVTEIYSNGPQDIICTDLGFQIPLVRPEIVKEICLSKNQVRVDFSPVYHEVK